MRACSKPFSPLYSHQTKLSLLRRTILRSLHKKSLPLQLLVEGAYAFRKADTRRPTTPGFICKWPAAALTLDTWEEMGHVDSNRIFFIHIKCNGDIGNTSLIDGNPVTRATKGASIFSGIDFKTWYIDRMGYGFISINAWIEFFQLLLRELSIFSINQLEKRRPV